LLETAALLEEATLSFFTLSLQFEELKLVELFLVVLFLLIFCSTYMALCKRSSISTNSFNSTTSLISWFYPLRKRTIVTSKSYSILAWMIRISISW